jgi:hypothetical protein
VRILREAGLVHVEARGRELHYSLDVRPLAQIYKRWLSRYEPIWDESLHRLKRNVEAKKSTRR